MPLVLWAEVVGWVGGGWGVETGRRRGLVTCIPRLQFSYVNTRHNQCRVLLQLLLGTVQYGGDNHHS